MTGPSSEQNGPNEPTETGGCKSMEGTSERCFVGSIDQGTTSSRFLIFDKTGSPVASHQIEFTQLYPQSGWVPCSLGAESFSRLNHR